MSARRYRQMCPSCAGSGKVLYDPDDPRPNPPRQGRRWKCPTCDGKGFVVLDPSIRNGPVATKEARRRCLRLIRDVTSHIVLDRTVVMASFPEDDGGMSLILHSVSAVRRLTFTIASDGTLDCITTIDEEAHLERQQVNGDEQLNLAPLTQWVVGAGPNDNARPKPAIEQLEPLGDFPGPGEWDD